MDEGIMATKAIKELLSVVRQTKYPLGAFVFVQRGLDHAVREAHGDPPPDADPTQSRHVSGPQLCYGLRDFAIREYGLLARTVLRRWRIYSCEDFGRIVFALIDAGLMHKTNDDTLDDFIDVYDFNEAFGRELVLAEPS